MSRTLAIGDDKKAIEIEKGGNIAIIDYDCTRLYLDVPALDAYNLKEGKDLTGYARISNTMKRVYCVIRRPRESDDINTNILCFYYGRPDLKKPVIHSVIKVTRKNFYSAIKRAEK